MEVAFVFGLSNSFSTFSAVLNYKWSPWIADHYNVTTALWVGAGVCGLSFVAALLLVQIDKKLHIASEKSEAASIRDLKLLGWVPIVPQQYLSPDSVSRRWLFWLLALQSLVNSCIGPFNNTATSVFLERDYFQQPPPLCQRCGLGYYNVYCDAVSPHCPNVPPFAWPLPLLSKNCSITSPFDQFQCSKAPPYILDEDINCDDVAWREGPFTHRYCATKSQAAETATSSLSYNPMVQTGLAPLAGWLVDLFGRRPMISVVAEIGVAVAHAAINYSQVTVTVPLLLLGVSQCFLQASMGSAFPPLYAHYDQYIPHVQVLFVGFGVANALLGVALVAMDRAHHGVLSRFSPPRDMDLDHKEPFLEAS
ncbi:hypothetical protein DYB34_004769 [Aphanomyces astaci]|uniref:Uncharacterized protein n=1 Tax=Aphanomyces astaci TaxID=112090 RepID=A0A397B3V8_APHAT|nr:hypothetical protein DYB36_005061 [Aphanomyces astaci]RHY67389.1 hypothetical protein DYB34_004769 [Aphanomyces astaci]RHZ39126.1 hypothetical protein DYB31_011428 [Aphanomyces astaci]